QQSAGETLRTSDVIDITEVARYRCVPCALPLMLGAHGQVLGRMRTAFASRTSSQRDPLQPLLVKYLHPLGLRSDDALSAEGAELAADNLARSAGCVGETLLSDVRDGESIMGRQGDL